MLDRIVRASALGCAVVAVGYGLLRGSWRAGASVLAGGVLISISYWAIRAAVDGVIARRVSGETPSPSSGWPLVKFFTRHAIVALVAYGMMVRLHLDPLGVLAGASSLMIGVAAEVIRDLRWRRFP